MSPTFSQSVSNGAPSHNRLSLENIETAARIIDPVFLGTPQFISEPLSKVLDAHALVKVETANPIRSFKGRGTDFFAANLPVGTPLITASAGNLGQAMAYVCRKRGLPLTIYASVNASPLKIERMKALGANVLLQGEDFDAAKIVAKRAAAASGVLMVEDGREARLSEGAGSIAIELLHHPDSIDVILVPLGNGAILGGMARWLKAHAPKIEVIGVAAAGAPCMEQSWRTGTLVETARVETIADGIGTRIPVPEALQDLTGMIDDIILVEDAAMIEGMRLAHRHLGFVLEPSGAAGIAALLTDRVRFRDCTVAAVLSGGNLTPEQAMRWLT